MNPPAPVAYVTLRNPATAVEQIGVSVEEDAEFEIQAFDGEIRRLRLARLELFVLGKKFTGEYLLTERSIGILGRNILNSIRILLDGPRRKWEEAKR